MHKLSTFGDARNILLETIIGLKNKEIPVERGLAIAANMKMINDNLHAEIKAAKLSLEAEKVGRDFGEIMRLGKRSIAGETPLIKHEEDED